MNPRILIENHSCKPHSSLCVLNCASCEYLVSIILQLEVLASYSELKVLIAINAVSDMGSNGK